MKTATLLTVLVLLLPAPALAHRVIASVFLAGDMIEGEIGFSNGQPAGNATVEVFDTGGNRIGETTTDADGFFVYAPAGPATHVFRANLGAGHLAEATLPASDFPGASGAADPPPAAPDETGTALTAAARAEIAAMLRDELRPLRREIAAYREKNDLQSILGGIGYICGIFGLGFFLMARRQLKRSGTS